MNTTENNDAILRDYILRAGQMHENYGFPRIFGEMGALLFLHDGPLSLDEIAEYLGVSKGSVSTNGRALVNMKFVRIVKKLGDRKDYYEYSGNLWPSLSEAIDSYIRSEVQDFEELNLLHGKQLDEGIKAGGPDSKVFNFTRRRMRELEELFRFLTWLSSLMKLLKTTPVQKLTGLINHILSGARK